MKIKEYIKDVAEIVIAVVCICGVISLCIMAIVFPVIIITGYGYQDICKKHEINGIIKCGIVAPDFGSEINLDIEHNNEK